jgi:acyl-CoA synthetase (NDP forming)
MSGVEKSRLYRITHPRSLAFWGASNNALSMGSVQLASVLALGYEGAIYPIHPKEAEVMGFKAYKSLADVPGPVDLAVVVLPTKLVPEILEQCGKAGVHHLIIVSAGFGEIDEDGKRMQQQLIDTANRYGITFLGPNCIGVVNTYQKLNTTFYPYVAKPGFIGMASQSGSFVTQMSGYLDDFDLGFSQAFSVGNEAVVDITDCLEYLGDSPETKVIALYIEAIRRGREFFKVAKEVSKKKPIVAYFVGGSSAGKKAAQSHTGALAGSDAVYDAMFRQCGVIRAQSIEELFDFCIVLGTQPLPRGNRVAVLTHSGGPGVSAADAAERSGLRLAEFGPETVAKMREVVPHTASVTNPVDLTFSRNLNEYLQTLPAAIMPDEGVDSLFVYLIVAQHRLEQLLKDATKDQERAEALARGFLVGQAEALAALPGKYGKPVVAGSFLPRSESLIQELQKRGCAVVPSPERAMSALAALTRYARMREALLAST